MITIAIDNFLCSRKTYNLPGGSFGEFSEIIKVVSRTFGLKRAVINIPERFFLFALKFYNKINSSPLLETYQVEKWLQNQPMDASKIKKDLQYQPLTFEQGIKLTIKP
jgi:nucleoside-diphosphate-sugar epimerase